MEGVGRKRKMEKEQEEEEDENEKMERFFALIKRTREVRQMMGMDGEKKKASDQEDKPPVVSAVWNPIFRPEDFVELVRANPQSKAHHDHDHDHDHDDHAITPPVLPVVVVAAGPSRREEDESQQQEHDKEGGGVRGDGDGLDLKLSL